jgi:DNA-binding NtrC family response regulator
MGSPRASGPLVVVDCTGLTESLFESELFGYEKGAFTGANQRKIGLAEAAHGGTLFLDEIGEVPMAMQVKLLRLIESGSFRPVGSLRTVHADFRLVSATHKPLKKMVAEGTFREDLYYRISGFPIRLPALRERVEDLPLLAESLLQRMAGKPTPSLTDGALKQLGLHPFPGNIRELRNILERARLFADDGLIRPEHLPEDIGPQSAPGFTKGRGHGDLSELAQALDQFQGPRSELARHLGMSERTLYRRLKALGMGTM